MTKLPDPLEHVPAELHELMLPFLSMAKKHGTAQAEQITTYVPLPWSDKDAEGIISNIVGEFDAKIRAEMPTLPDLVFTAMSRQHFASFSDRLDQLYDGAGSTPHGGST